MGAMLGGAVCGAARESLPWFEGSTGVYALIGMGTLFAGILRAPFTSVFMIVEVSGNYSIVLPVMISNTIAYLISRRYQREPIFDVLAAQDGVSLPSMEQQRESMVRRVEDAMRAPLPALDAEERVAVALERASHTAARQVLVHTRDGAWRVATAEMLQLFLNEGKGDLAAGSVLGLTTPLPIVHPDHSLDTALRRLGDAPLLPVVHRADPRRLVGVIAIEDILAHYRSRVDTGH
jgi:CIC family chloride channel protein